MAPHSCAALEPPPPLSAVGEAVAEHRDPLGIGRRSEAEALSGSPFGLRNTHKRLYLKEVDPLPRMDAVVDNRDFARPKLLTS